MWKRLGTVIAMVTLAAAPLGLSCSASTPIASPTTTTLPESLWLGQARVWYDAHASTLTAISAAAQNLGDAAKAGSGTLAQMAAQEVELQVGLADGTLADNAFGHDMHRIFVEYANALATIRAGILANDQAKFKGGADALARAVADFGTISTRMSAATH